MIVSFADRGTQDIYSGINSKAARQTLPPALWAVAGRKLSYLAAAQSLQDLAAPPSNRLEALRGDLSGWWSIRINEQYRVVFRFEAGDARDVWIGDYH